MAMWNPWRGCKKYSDGCLYCYIHKGDAKKGIENVRVFVYNVCIAVPGTVVQERRMNIYVHCKCYS